MTRTVAGLAIHRGDRMSNRQDMMGDRRASMGQARGQSRSITRGSAAVLPTVHDHDRRAIQMVGRSALNGDSGRNRMAPASSPGRVRSRAAAAIERLCRAIRQVAVIALFIE